MRIGLAASVATAIAIGVASLTGGASSTLLANVFTVASGGTSSCVRDATPRLYSYAVANEPTMLCGPSSGGALGNSGIAAGSSIENACYAATGGDIVGMKDGVYAHNTANGMIMETAHDCSDGTGADVNPNCVEQGVTCNSTANWVTYKCVDTDCGTINGGTNTFNLSWEVGGMIFARANYHVRFLGVPFNTGVKTNYGGESAGQQAKNLSFEGVSRTDKAQFFGIQIIGSNNILLKNLNYGPTIQCAANDANAATNFWCDSAGPWFEKQFAFFDSNSVGCTPIRTDLCGGFFGNGGSDWTEPYVHDGGAGAYTNIRFQDVDMHDMTGKRDGTGIHPGCIFTFDSGNSTSTASHNMVWDHVNCERTGGAVIQLADSGVTIQNSTFSCMADSPQNTGGQWDQCASGAIIGTACKPMALSTSYGSNKDVTYTRASSSTNLGITIANVVSGLNTVLSVGVVGSAVTVNLATNGAGVATSTADQIIAAVNASGAATALLTAARKSGQNGTGVPTAAFTAQGVTCSIPTNDLFRFNSITAGNTSPGTAMVFSNLGPLGCCGSNMRVIGNIINTTTTCSGLVTYARNVYSNSVSSCGETGAVSLAGDPFNISSNVTPGHIYSLTGSVMDYHLDGSPAIATFDASALGSDYALDHDCDSAARTITLMRYGACN